MLVTDTPEKTATDAWWFTVAENDDGSGRTLDVGVSRVNVAGLARLSGFVDGDVKDWARGQAAMLARTQWTGNDRTAAIEAEEVAGPPAQRIVSEIPPI